MPFNSTNRGSKRVSGVDDVADTVCQARGGTSSSGSSPPSAEDAAARLTDPRWEAWHRSRNAAAADDDDEEEERAPLEDATPAASAAAAGARAAADGALRRRAIAAGARGTTWVACIACDMVDARPSSLSSRFLLTSLSLSRWQWCPLCFVERRHGAQGLAKVR